MARPLKQGLDYFPVDIDMDQDDKIYMLEAELGEASFGRLMKLLMEVYRGGYFKRWGEDDELVFAGKKRIPLEEVRALVSCALQHGFFDEQLYQEHGVLSSAGIQRRYVQACEKRQRIVMDPRYCLIDPRDFSDTISAKLTVDTEELHVSREETPPDDGGERVSGEKTPVIRESTPQRRVEERKGEERTPAHIRFTLEWYRRYTEVTASLVTPSSKDNEAAAELFRRIDPRASPLEKILEFYFWPGLEQWWAVDSKTKKRTYNFRGFCTNWTSILADMKAAEGTSKRRRLCPHCGAPVPGTMQFCTACGKDFDEPAWEAVS